MRLVWPRSASTATLRKRAYPVDAITPQNIVRAEWRKYIAIKAGGLTIGPARTQRHPPHRRLDLAGPGSAHSGP